MVIRLLTLVLALLIWTPANAALDVDFGRYHALVIGINDLLHLQEHTSRVMLPYVWC